MYEEIAREIEAAKANRAKTAMVHFQVLVNADRLEGVDPEEFCERVGIEPSWGLEFHKMINLARLLSERGYEIVER